MFAARALAENLRPYVRTSQRMAVLRRRTTWSCEPTRLTAQRTSLRV